MAKFKALLRDTYDTIKAETVRNLQEEFPTINFYKAQEKDDNFTSKLKKANIIYGVPTQKEIKKAQNLQWLQLESAGVDRYLDRDLYQNEDIILTNASGVYGLPISEHILSLILAFNRRLHLHISQKKEHVWQGHRVKKDFSGSVLGIIGLGDIGDTLARKASDLGCEILAVKNNPQQKPDYVKELLGPEGLNRVLKKSDFVVLALPLTEKTEKIIAQKELELMKDDSFIVNIGRGKLIDQPALIKALEEDWIAGAGLDVTDPEPLPEDNRLWELENVIITPHNSGLSPTNWKRKLEIFRENLQHFVNDEPLINQVDFERGY